VRRLTLLFAGGAVWLFLAAIPVFADGGPHIASTNNGTSVAGLTSDSCAGCHRAHTAQGFDLTQQDGADLCLVCHGASGTGATTNVVNGVQYSLAGGVLGTRGALLGANRAGGFTTAAIATDQGVRVAATGTPPNVRFNTKVPVASTGSAVTSRHMNLNGTSFGPGKAWGNGGLNTGPGPGVSLECTTCHNPHGNGNYRILNPIPINATTGGFVVPTTGVVVNDDSANSGVTRNYTVIQVASTGGYTLTATKALADSPAGWTSGNYLVRKVPWNGGTGGTGLTTNADAPNGLPGSFNTQITAWCSQCHTRYMANDTTNIPQQTSSGDAIFTYRHGTNRSACTTCHVTHGSNAKMPGTFSSAYPYPGGTPLSASSRLLKADNRGTCQLCHDPTGTVTTGGPIGPQVGPTPVPLVP